MTLSTTFVLFITMVVLAVLPGPGIMVVVSRSLAQGFGAGVMTAFGVVCGDYIFIALAISGLSLLSDSLSVLLTVVRYLGAAYLLFLGVSLLRQPSAIPLLATARFRFSSHYLAGLLVTLANPKAILFYASFFPAFVNLRELSGVDIFIIYGVTAVAVGGVMVFYAFVVSRGRALVTSTLVAKAIRYLSSALLVVCGLYIVLRQ